MTLDQGRYCKFSIFLRSTGWVWDGGGGHIDLKNDEGDIYFKEPNLFTLLFTEGLNYVLTRIWFVQ